jgi:hypothetical protein
MVVSRGVVDIIQITGIVLGLLGIAAQNHLSNRYRLNRPLAIVFYLVVWAVVGAVAPINGWLFSGTQSVAGIPAYILNSLTFVTVMASMYFAGPTMFGTPMDIHYYRSVILGPFIGMLYAVFLVGIGHATYVLASGHHLGLVLTILSVVGSVLIAVLAYYVIGGASQRWSIGSKFLQYLGVIMSALGVLAQFVSPGLDLLGIKIV